MAEENINRKQNRSILPKGDAAETYYRQVKIVGQNGEDIYINNDRLGVEADFIAGAKDAFSRLRVSEPRIIFNAYFTYNTLPNFFTRDVVGGGAFTYNANHGSVDLTVSANGDSALNQTKRYFHYVAGLSNLILQTAKMAQGQPGLIQEVGLFDNNNGLFLRKNNTDLSFVIRSNTSGSPVETVIPRANWNGDKLDGTGESGITLDTTKDNIYAIDYQWLGAGTVRFGFNLNGNFIICHIQNNANTLDISYMRTAILPIRQRIYATEAITGTPTLKTFCCSVQSEGPIDIPIQRYSASLEAVFKSVTATSFTPVVSIRLKAANIRGELESITANVLSDANKSMQFNVYLNPTLTGAVWTSAGANSIAEFDTTATAITGGRKLDAVSTLGAGAGNLDLSQTLDKIVADYAGVSDILTVAARSFQTTGSAWASLTWKERF